MRVAKLNDLASSLFNALESGQDSDFEQFTKLQMEVYETVRWPHEGLEILAPLIDAARCKVTGFSKRLAGRKPFLAPSHDALRAYRSGQANDYDFLVGLEGYFSEPNPDPFGPLWTTHPDDVEKSYLNLLSKFTAENDIVSLSRYTEVPANVASLCDELLDSQNYPAALPKLIFFSLMNVIPSEKKDLAYRHLSTHKKQMRSQINLLGSCERITDALSHILLCAYQEQVVEDGCFEMFSDTYLDVPLTLLSSHDLQYISATARAAAEYRYLYGKTLTLTTVGKDFSEVDDVLIGSLAEPDPEHYFLQAPISKYSAQQTYSLQYLLALALDEDYAKLRASGAGSYQELALLIGALHVYEGLDTVEDVVSAFLEEKSFKFFPDLIDRKEDLAPGLQYLRKTNIFRQFYEDFSSGKQIPSLFELDFFCKNGADITQGGAVDFFTEFFKAYGLPDAMDLLQGSSSFYLMNKHKDSLHHGTSKNPLKEGTYLARVKAIRNLLVRYSQPIDLRGTELGKMYAYWIEHADEISPERALDVLSFPEEDEILVQPAPKVFFADWQKIVSAKVVLPSTTLSGSERMIEGWLVRIMKHATNDKHKHKAIENYRRFVGEDVFLKLYFRVLMKEKKNV